MSDITEEQVVAWMKARLSKVAPALKPSALSVVVYANYDMVTWYVNDHEKAAQSFNGPDGAVADLIKTNAEIAANGPAQNKRVQAAALLKEAEELEAATQQEATP